MKRKVIIGLFVVFFLFSALSAGTGYAGETLPGIQLQDAYRLELSTLFQSLEKPVVALALCGGGARGYINAGVIMALREAGIPLDMVVGTSMGSVIGVMYGSGLTVEQIRTVGKSNLIPELLEVNILPSGALFETRRFNNFMQILLPRKRLEEFVLPTALLSYDLTAGEKFIQSRGQVSDVIQGTYAIPLLFPVQELAGSFLMDAGILEITPAQAAKMLGADVVIATTAFDRAASSNFANPISSWLRFIDLLQQYFAGEVIGEYADFTIDCEVSEYDMFDFDLTGLFYQIGYETAREKIPAIKEMLAEKGIPLTDERGEREPLLQSGEMEMVFADLRNEREKIDFSYMRPVISSGSGDLLFQHKLDREGQAGLQYGLKYWNKDFRARLVQQGGRGLDLEIRLLRFLADLDLEIQISFSGTAYQDRQELVYYGLQTRLGAGLARLQDGQFYHLGMGYYSQGPGWEGEADLFIPAAGGQKGRYVVSASYSSKIGLFEMKPSLVYSNNAAIAPDIFRGFGSAAAGEELLQCSLEGSYYYHLSQPKGLGDVLELKGLELYQFLDYQKQQDEDFALGAGIDLEFAFFGIKPIRIGGYLAYDLTAEEFTGGLHYNFSF